MRNNPIATRVTSTTRSWTDANGELGPGLRSDESAPSNGDMRPVGEPELWQPFWHQVRSPSAQRMGCATRGSAARRGHPARVRSCRACRRRLTYHQRWFTNFTATDNVLVGPSDYSPYSIVAPTDPRLPDGGGYTIGDLWDINPQELSAAVDDFVAPSKDYGEQVRYWHGVDVNISGRMRNSLMFEEGTSTGRLVTDNCAVTPKLDNPSERFCRVVAPFATQFKGLTRVHDPEGGRAVERDDPEPAGGQSRREPGRAELSGRGANTGSAAGRPRPPA